MVSFLLQCVGDIIVFRVMWKGYKMTTRKQQKMFETEHDFKMRVLFGYGIIVFGVTVILLNHFFFKF
jgi:hypothetical protein